MSAAAATSIELPPALRLWQSEVERLTSNQEELGDAAREMLRRVLLALAIDPASDRETRRDVRRMLEAVAPAHVPRLEAVGDDPAAP